MNRRERIGWLVRRLRAMGPAEIAWRVRQTLAARLEQAGWGLAAPRAPAGACGPAWFDTAPAGLDAARYARAADRVLSGTYDVFALKDLGLGFPPPWDVDPRTGVRAPAVFGKRIDYRDPRVCGDVKYLWEINRHLELVTLAQAWRLTGAARYAQGCRRMLESWFDACPYPMGPNWTSSLEHGIRLVNWSVAWHLLGGDGAPVFDGADGQAFRARWLRSVREHCHFIRGWLSRHSSANNHLLGETMGLFVGALTWPLWPESAAWREDARVLFAHEALLQTGPDGVNREQAVWYQHSVMEMMLICRQAGRAAGCGFGADFDARLHAMFDYVAALTDRSGRLPMMGDSDDALMVRWDPDGTDNPFPSLLMTGAVLFDRADWAAAAARGRACDPRGRGHDPAVPDDRNAWLLGAAGAAAHARFVSAPPHADARRMRFDDGGIYLLGTRFGEDDEVLAVVDAGPLGYGAIAAHGHADALSITLSAYGRQLLVDPGTYAYHTEKAWRDHFRSTFAHNTVCIDGCDQSVSGGNFLWLDKAQAHCRVHAVDGPVQCFEGEHDGYLRLPDPVVHRRRIRFEPDAARFVVEDEIDGRGRHTAQICWHLAEDCTVSSDGRRVTARSGGVELTIEVPDAPDGPRLLRGRESPPAGWMSRSFDARTPIFTVVWDCAAQGKTVVTTILSIRRSDAGGVH